MFGLQDVRKNDKEERSQLAFQDLVDTHIDLICLFPKIPDPTCAYLPLRNVAKDQFLAQEARKVGNRVQLLWQSVSCQTTIDDCFALNPEP